MTTEDRDREKLFYRAWKRHFGTVPRDWSKAEVDGGTSSFLDFRAWLLRESPDMDRLERVLTQLAAERDQSRYVSHPSFAAVVAVYGRMARFIPDDPGQTCEVCFSSGYIPVVVVRRKGVLRALHPDDAPKACEAESRVTYCGCSVGRRQAEREGDADQHRPQVAMDHRFHTTLARDDYAAACRALLGAQNAERAVASDAPGIWSYVGDRAGWVAEDERAAMQEATT